MIIYLDMDGVLADFDRFCIETLGKHFTEFNSSAEAWAAINEHPHIYRVLDPMPDAHKLVSGVQSLANAHGHMVAILTALPRIGKIPLCERHKREWIEQYFPSLTSTFNIGPYAPDKQNWANIGDVLVDDMHINIDQWNAKGGYGIIHTTAESSLQTLQQYLKAQ